MKAWHLVIPLLCLSSATWANIAETPCEASTPGRLRPVIATHTLPPYPEIAKRQQEEGVSLVQVVIGRDGIVSDATLVKSSGSQTLDDAAVDYVKQNWRWEVQVGRCAAPVTTRVNITWSLHEKGFDPLTMSKVVNIIEAKDADYPPEALAARQSGFVLMMVLQPPDAPSRVYVMTSSGVPALDRKSIEIASTRLKSAVLDDMPMGALVPLVIVWTLPGTPRPDPDKIRAVLEFNATHRFGRDAVAPPSPP